MNNKRTIKFQFMILIILDVILWAVFSEIYWTIIEHIFYDRPQAEEAAPAFTNFLYVAGSVIIPFFCTLPVFITLMKSINRPVKQIIAGIKGVAEGKHDIKLKVKGAAEFEEIASAFNLMSEELSKLDKMKAEIEKERILLFANMAHDIKTPVTSILGYSKAISDGMVNDDAKKTEYLQTITKKAARINELVDRLFEYVKLESPENVLHKADCDVAEILRNATAALYTEIEENSIALEVNITERTVIKNVDRLEIDRVFTNLINNAVKHNRAGITLYIEMDENGHTIIADTGDKIPVEVSENLFKPFVLGDQSRTSRNGSGLGLALAYKIMKKHDGNLTFFQPYKEFSKAFIISF